MKKISINKNLFIKNRKKVTKNIKPGSLAIITSNDELTRSGDQYFGYRQNSGMFYLTGLEQEKCILALCPDHPDEKLREIIFTIQPNEKLETWTGHKYTREEIQDISGIKTVKWLDDFNMTIRDLALNSDYIYLNLNEYIKYESPVIYNDQRMVADMKQRYPLHGYHRLAPVITNARMVKEKEETELIRQACDITNSAFQRVLKFLKPGVTEYQVEAEITHEFIVNGARGHAYQPIVGSGKNALVLHYVKNWDSCNDGDLLLMDFGAEYGNYAADCTRTIPVNGKFTKRQKDCYNAVLKVQKEAIKLFVPGNTIDKVNKTAFKLMEKELVKLGLLSQEDIDKQGQDKPLYTKYLMHGITHFLGLDVHDVGGKYEPFKKGMVLTCEPGLYIKEEGIGIRIENDIMVAENPVDLMAAIPREVEEIEALMNN